MDRLRPTLNAKLRGRPYGGWLGPAAVNTLRAIILHLSSPAHGTRMTNL
jgi:hypothetical protein